jgi:hypothetical protein
MLLEQAVFTSVRGGRLDGYQLAAQSAGVSGELAKELTVWGPAHDSLWRSASDARSINFHALAGGDYCLSRTTLAGAEYSGRAGARIYTQMTVLSAEALGRFANDPFLIYRALAAAGRFLVCHELNQELPRIALLGQNQGQDDSLARQVAEEIGAEVFAELVEAASSQLSVAVITSGNVDRLFQAVLRALTPAERLALSFTTGLRGSLRRPFRLCALPNDPAALRHSPRVPAAKVIELRDWSPRKKFEQEVI